METSIITIGNSKGIRIPKPLLEESGLSGKVRLKATKGRISIVIIKLCISVSDFYTEKFSLNCSSKHSKSLKGSYPSEHNVVCNYYTCGLKPNLS